MKKRNKGDQLGKYMALWSLLTGCFAYILPSLLTIRYGYDRWGRKPALQTGFGRKEPLNPCDPGASAVYGGTAETQG